MTQYNEVVQYQKNLLEAEEWSWGWKSIHIHCLQSMWYDTRPQDTEEGINVSDVQYNNGVIIRSKNGKEIHRFGSPKTGTDLVHSYIRNTAR